MKELTTTTPKEPTQTYWENLFGDYTYIQHRFGGGKLQKGSSWISCDFYSDYIGRQCSKDLKHLKKLASPKARGSLIDYLWHRQHSGAEDHDIEILRGI